MLGIGIHKALILVGPRYARGSIEDRDYNRVGGKRMRGRGEKDDRETEKIRSQ